MRRLALPSLGLGLLLPLLSLPPFATGYWDKAEPLVIGLHLGGALAALAAFLALKARPKETQGLLAHPFVLIPLAGGVWSVLTMPFLDAPLLSLLGAPQSGMGGLWLFDAAAYTAAARLVMADQPKAWRGLLWLALFAALATGLLKLWDWRQVQEGGSHLLIFVSAYYGWLALALPVLAFALPGLGRADKVLRLLMLLAAALLAAVSQSLSVVFFLLLGAGWAALLLLRPSLGRILSSGLAAFVVAAVGIAAWSALHLSPDAWLSESLLDRSLIQRLVQADLAAKPWSLLTGNGWGQTQNAFHVWLNLSGQRIWNPSWTFLTSDYFHSHHWALEALHAQGVPGLLLALAAMAAIPLYAQDKARAAAGGFAIALAGLSSFWFPLGFFLPWGAMALAVLADGTVWPLRLAPLVWRWGAAALSATQLAAAVLLLGYGLAFTTLRQAWEASPPLALAPPADLRGQDLAAAELIRDALDLFAKRAVGEDAAPLAQTLNLLLDFIDRQSAGTSSLMLLESGLSAMARIHVSGDLAFAATPKMPQLWRRWLERALDQAPGRTDLAIPYLAFALGRGAFDEVGLVTGRLLAQDAGDPVGLHYRGLVLLLAGRRDEGLANIGKALDNGIERFMPIEDGVKALVGTH